MVWFPTSYGSDLPLIEKLMISCTFFMWITFTLRHRIRVRNAFEKDYSSTSLHTETNGTAVYIELAGLPVRSNRAACSGRVAVLARAKACKKTPNEQHSVTFGMPGHCGFV